MSRLSRKKWEIKDFGPKYTKGLFGMLDASIKQGYRITDDEYDFICGEASDEELDLFLEEKKSFNQKRLVIQLLHKYIQY
jgi:hypothetical protein